MSKMAELAYDIEQLYIEGKSAKSIARELGCPLAIVEDWIAEQRLGGWDEIEDPHVVDCSPYATINS